MTAVAVDLLLAVGVALILLGCAGVAVMSDVYDRLHFGGPAALGAALICVAVLVEESFSLIGNKALLVGALLLSTAPVLTHATARAARVREHGDWRLEARDGVEIEEA